MLIVLFRFSVSAYEVGKLAHRVSKKKYICFLGRLGLGENEEEDEEEEEEEEEKEGEEEGEVEEDEEEKVSSF